MWPSFFQDYPLIPLNPQFLWNLDSFLSLFHLKTNKPKPKGCKELEVLDMCITLIVIMGSQVCAHGQIHWTVNSKYVQFFVKTSQANKQTNNPWIPIVPRVKFRICHGHLIRSYIKKLSFTSLISSNNHSPSFTMLQAHWLSFLLLEMPTPFLVVWTLIFLEQAFLSFSS